MRYGNSSALVMMTYYELGSLGLVAVGLRSTGGVALDECEVADPVQSYLRCGCRGKSLESVVRRLVDEPFGIRFTVVLVRAGP